jgi:hypothetical protein
MSEHQKIISSLKKSGIEWYVADISSTNGDRVATIKMLEKITAAVPKPVVMAMSASVDQLCIVVSPNGKSEAWLKSAISSFPIESDASVVTDADSNIVSVTIKQDSAKGIFPFPLMESARANAFAFLKSAGLIKDEDSDDDDGGVLAMSM